jgi:hypothetical protein
MSGYSKDLSRLVQTIFVTQIALLWLGESGKREALQWTDTPLGFSIGDGSVSNVLPLAREFNLAAYDAGYLDSAMPHTFEILKRTEEM